jgi:hypothetical protein
MELLAEGTRAVVNALNFSYCIPPDVYVDTSDC